MKRILTVAFLITFIAAFQITGASALYGQVAGTQPLGATVEELKLVAEGWSAKKSILGKEVYNGQDQKIGKIDDLIIAKDMVTYAIIGTGGFVGLARHNVAIPFSQLTMQDNRFVLPGATKEALRAMPEFQYAQG